MTNNPHPPNQPPSVPQTPPPSQSVAPSPVSPPPTPAVPPNPQPPPTLPPPQASPATAAGGHVSTKVLLLVEDDPLLINMYQTKFSHEGFQVYTATDGEVGLTLAKAEKPDIIILDIMMPKMDGIEVLRRLKNDPNFSQIPILMLSNLSEMAKQKEAFELGAKEFLVKANLTPTQVVEKIKLYLNQVGAKPTQ